MRDPLPLLTPLLELHDAVRDGLLLATERQQPDELAGVSREKKATRSMRSMWSASVSSISSRIGLAGSILSF